MRLTLTYRGWIAGLAIVLATAVPTGRALADSPNLFTPGNIFTTSSHYVSATVFPWFTSTGGQVDGPWRPVEGRAAWTGEPAFWQTQIKQMMAANIDVINVQWYPGSWEQQRTNLFQAMHDLRAQGYNVPRVAPLLDTALTSLAGWTPGHPDEPIDLSTTAGKDAFVNQYVQFYQDYYSANPDAQADSYIAQLSNRVLLNCWQMWPTTDNWSGRAFATNTASLTRADVQSRLTSALGGNHALFNNMPTTGTFMINAANGDQMSFRDEILPQFESNTEYYSRATWDSQGLRAATVKPGYWDQNVRNPGGFLPRSGGSNYAAAWTSVQTNRGGFNGIKHVNVESWNEYDEGSGIYAANPGPPYIKSGSGNTNTDTWSSTNDPYQYIKTTAAGARQFNDTPDRSATILWNSLPFAMGPGQTRTVQVIVRNDGDVSWTGAAGFKLGELSDPTMFGPGRYLIDDTTNEIPTYGGIFRGRPITFDVQLTAPTTFGTYATHWQMVDENVAWFGQELTAPIAVALYGDANMDGRVDVLDLAILAANYRKQVTGGWSMADFNGDGVVDVKDLALLAANYRHSLASDVVPAYDGLDAEAIRALSLAGVTMLPEPGALVLLLVTGLIGLLAYAWRKRKMKAATGVFALVMSLVLAAMPAAAANKVFLLAGQSNMQGVGVAADLPAPYNAPQSNVKFWNNGWVDLRGGFGYASGYFGPEVTFGYTLAHTVFPNDNIYLVKYASGGSALADQAKRWTTKGSGVCYNTFTSTVNAAMRNLRDAGLSPAIVGMIWMQGESDAVNHTYAAAYAANMTTFIAAVRSDFATPAMQFVAGRIMNYSSYPFGTPVDNALVRRALATVPDQVGHASWIDTDDLKVWPHGGNHEGHYSTQGQIDLGVRFAKQFAQAPEPSAPVLLDTGLTGLLAWACKRRK